MNIELERHQIAAVKFIKNDKNRGVILFHSTGSGKTLASLSAAFQLGKDIIIIGKKSSRKAFVDDMMKAGLEQTRVQIYSFTKVKNVLHENPGLFNDKTVIIDEAHHLRTDTGDNLNIISCLRRAYKIILLTATPVINYLNDLSVLVNIVKYNDVLPTERNLFNSIYFDEYNFVIHNKKLLLDKLRGCISYYDNKDTEDYPTSEAKVEEVKMSDEQFGEYKNYIKKVLEPKLIQTGGNEDIELDINTLEKSKKNFFLNVTRQLSNAVDNEISPKIQRIYDTITTGKFPCICYSNFLRRGIFLIVPLLEKNNISYKAITGDTSMDKMNHIIDKYNKGDINVLLISSAGSDSLDLHNTRQIHIFEPHWNESKITQVIGRAIRYKSHSELPIKDRHVMVYRWISVFPKKVKVLSADQYLTELSEKKTAIFDKFLDIIKEASIERNGLAGGSLYYGKYMKYKTKYLALREHIKLGTT